MSDPETQPQAPEATMPTAPIPNLNPLKTKKYWRNLAITVAAIVIITVVITSQVVNVTGANSTSQTIGYEPGEHTENVLSGQIVLNPVGMFIGGFTVPDEAKTATLCGNYTIMSNGTSTGNLCTMTIWSQAEFQKYIGQQDAVPCYNKDFMPHTSDNLNVTLTKGSYIILIGGVRTGPETLEAQLDLNFTV